MKSGELTLYRGCVPVVDDRYEEDGDQSPVQAVVDALAEAAGVDPLELPPLYDYVDPEGIDRLFDGDGAAGETAAVLSFSVDSWNVFVRADGRIRVCDATRSTEPAPVFDSAPV